jgi:hypothetical protein
MSSVKVAVIQHAPVFLNIEESLEKARASSKKRPVKGRM